MKAPLLVATLITVLFSCQKSSNDLQPVQDDYVGKYKITQLVFRSNGNPDQNLLANMPDCALDDLLVFTADKIFKKEDAGLPCDQTEEESAVWFAKGNKMNIDGVESEVLSFDKHTLVLATAVEFGIPGTIIETLVKQ